jgi:tetratricopeptide (TPR) repeat protein
MRRNFSGGDETVSYAGWHRHSDRRLRKGQRLHEVSVYYAVRHEFAEAEECERLAVETLSKAAPGLTRSKLLAAALTGLGQVARLQGHYEEAENALRQALALMPARPGAVRVGALTGLGIVCKDTGRFSEAEQMYRRVDQELKQTGSTDDVSMANLLHNRAGLAHVQGSFANGESLARQAVAARTKALGAKHLLVAQDESVLAANLAGQGKYDEAEALYRRVLARLGRHSPRDDYEIAVNQHGLAAVLAGRQKYAEAEKLYRKTLKTKQKALGAEHPDVGLVLNNLGVLLRDRGRHEEAATCFGQCLPILEKALGPEHPMVALAQRNREANTAARGH